MQKNDKKLSNEEMFEKAECQLRRYAHSRRKLYRAMQACLPPLGRRKSPDMEAVKLAIKVVKIMDLFAESSRAWSISVHWLFTVCNPRIENASN